MCIHALPSEPIRTEIICTLGECIYLHIKQTFCVTTEIMQAQMGWQDGQELWAKMTSTEVIVDIISTTSGEK
jgi:hypothetical protein